MPNNSTKYVTAFSGSAGSVYVVKRNVSEWIPITASVREPNQDAMDSIIDEDYREIIPVGNAGQLMADFQYENFESASVPLTVDFVDSSTGGNIVNWFWKFGDGNISSQQSPQHTYTTMGIYSVTMSVTTSDGSADEEIKKDIIGAGILLGDLNPSFVASPRVAAPGTTIEFTNTSTGPIATNHWNFGDGTTGSQQSPLHTYNAVGLYTVTLTISDSGSVNSAQEILEDYIEIKNGIGQKVSAIDCSNGGHTELKWNSSLIHDYTGSFAIETMFRMGTTPEAQPGSYPTLFKAWQQGLYTTDFPTMFKPKGDYTTDDVWIYSLPITWNCHRGFGLSIQKSTGKAYFVVNVKNMLPSFEHDPDNANYNSGWMDLYSNELNNYAMWPLAGYPVQIRQDIADNISDSEYGEWNEIATGTLFVSMVDQDFTYWYEKNTHNINTEPKSWYRVYSTETLITDHWYYVYAVYENTGDMKMFVKDLTDNRWFTPGLNTSAVQRKIKPLNRQIGATESLSKDIPWGNKVKVDSMISDPLTGQYITSYTKTNMIPVDEFIIGTEHIGPIIIPGPSYDVGVINPDYIHQPVSSREKIRFPGNSPNNMFYGDIKYIRMWKGNVIGSNLFQTTTDLEPYIFIYEIPSNHPHYDRRFGDWAMNNGSGEFIDDVSGLAMKSQLKSGTSEDETVEWKEIEIP